MSLLSGIESVVGDVAGALTGGAAGGAGGAGGFLQELMSMFEGGGAQGGGQSDSSQGGGDALGSIAKIAGEVAPLLMLL